jgi:DNA-binding MarR family transcriptional regulator
MNLSKIIKRLWAAPQDPRELRRVARALGQELPRARLSQLRDFRAEIGRLWSGTPTPGREHEYASGYVACMVDVTAEYEVTLRQHEDEHEYQNAAQHEGWRDMLLLLRNGPMLPSAIAEQLGVDRSTVTRSLSRMRAAGVVEVANGDSLDGRTRPHRMTLAGQRLLGRLQQSMPQDVRRGIRLAVSLISHVMKHSTSAANELENLALAELGDAQNATQAIEAWTEASTEHGLLHDIRAYVSDAHEPAGATAAEPPQLSSNAPWQRAPLVLAHVQPGPAQDSVPLYVRTSNDAWPAWAYALSQENGNHQSRAIVDRDIRTRTIQPPDQPFRLVYDDPSAISQDRDDPTMRELIARADEKFVVAYSDDELDGVPTDFVAIPMAAGDARNG